MISHFCIKRPIFAAVISIVIVLVGLGAMLGLPVAQYPEITPPTITVSASYPGADSETVANALAAPIEAQVNGVDNMLYMQSTSSSTGNYTLTVYFDVGTDPDIAQVQVQNRVSLATPQLPDTVQKTGVNVQKRSSAFLMLIAIYSPENRYDERYIANYANVFVLDAIKRIPGANQASVLGVPDQAMRLWLKPDRMAALGITPADVQRAVAAQNEQFSAGAIGRPPTPAPVELTYPVVTQGRFNEPKQFEDIILRTDAQGAATVQLRDVGRAELGQRDYSLRSNMNGQPATVIAIYQQADSNALDVAQNLRETMEALKRSFPAGLDYRVSLDTTSFVQASIEEVIHTLFEAVILVVVVVFLFLQNLRATLIPTLAVFISIIGTFAGMYLLGFSINLLTLFGLVLAIGIVVDDAIVVIENVERNMHEFHLSPREAAFKAMDEVTGPVIAIVLVLSAVFIPTAFVAGTTGLLYKQFAITIVVSVALSGLVALTLTPALAALLLKPQHGSRGRFFDGFNRGFDWLTERYGAGVRGVLRRSLLALVVFGVMVALLLQLFRTVPGSFVPPEDQGYLLGAAFLPDAASLDRAETATRKAAALAGRDPAVFDYTALSGYSLIDGQFKNNAGTLFLSLKDFKQRGGEDASAEALLAKFAHAFAGIKEALVIPINPPPIPGLGTQGGFEFWIQSRGQGSPRALQAQVEKFLAAAAQRPELAQLTSTYRAASRQLRVDVDRARAEVLGVPIADVYSALQTLFGSLYVSQYNQSSRVWQVILQAEPQYRQSPEDIQNIYVRGRSGQMVPLSAVATTRFITGPDLLPRFNAFPAAKVNGDAGPGYSSGQAIQAMEEVAREVLPDDYSFAWSGIAYEEKKSGAASSLVFVAGLIMVFLILAAQYESWGLPMSVITAVPFGIFGALVAVWARGLENDVYFQIGLVTLIGLAAKNAILIVEFAVLKRNEGLSAFDAAVEAARLRLRPIIMTSAAFILGALPLALASGAGANSRHSIGTGIIGGMLGATTLALFFVPLFYVLIETAADRLRRHDKTPPAPQPSAEEMLP